MANVNISPNMGLPIPIPGQELGPQWAIDLANCLTLLDAHTHTPHYGVLITPNGISINGDLPFNGNSLLSLKSARFVPLSTPLSGVSDIGCLYESGVDLYYNDGVGNPIRLTQGGAVAGSAGTITGLPSGTASASYQSASGTFVFIQSTSTAANFDVGSIAIRYPGSYPTPSGNYIQLQAPSTLSTGYSITLPSTPPASGGAFLTSDTSASVAYTNVDNSTLEINSALLRVKASGVTGTQIIPDVNLQGNAVKENNNNLVVSSTNAATSLAIIRGSVNTITGTVAGEGFSVVKNGVGDITINFNVPFLSTPVTVATVQGGTGPNTVQSLGGSTTTAVRFLTFDSGSLGDNVVDFISIGPRT